MVSSDDLGLVYDIGYDAEVEHVAKKADDSTNQYVFVHVIFLIIMDKNYENGPGG